MARSDFSWERVFNPSDILYLPPEIIHYGKALDDDCMTLFIGFRAADAVSLLATAVEATCSRNKKNFSTIVIMKYLQAPLSHQKAIHNWQKRDSQIS